MAPSLTLYAGTGASKPNPRKIHLYLLKLKVEYHTVNLSFDHKDPNGIKGAKYLALNPNGLLPALTDSDNNVTVWETGAILNYLSEKYDKDGLFSGKDLTERAQIQTWLFFQVSGLGPMNGQLEYMHDFFKPSYGEEAPESVKKRFVDELNRLYKVLDGQLERQEKIGSDFIVLDRVTIVDIVFFGSVGFGKHFGIDLSRYPKVFEWNKRMQNDPDVLEVAKRFPSAN